MGQSTRIALDSRQVWIIITVTLDPKIIRFYRLPNGTEPFGDWLSDVPDKIARKNIHSRITLLGKGHLGVHRRIGPHLIELKVGRRPGYRIYCCQPEPDIIVVLHGGTKHNQPSDIQKALSYLEDLG